MDGVHSAKNAVKGTGFVLFSNILNAVLGFATSAVIARGLGIEAFGKFSLTLAIFGIALMFSGLGVGTSAVRLIAEQIGKKRRDLAGGVMKRALLVVASSGLVIAAAFFILSGDIAIFFQKEISGYLKIASIGIFFAGLMAFLMSVFQGLQKLELYSFTTIFNTASKLLLVVALVGLGAEGALSGIVIAYVLTGVVGFYLLKKAWDFSLKTADYPYRKLFSLSLPLAFVGWLNFIMSRSSMYLLGLFSGSMDIGIYGGALVFAQALFIVPDAMGTALLPALSEIKGRGGGTSLAGFVKYTLKFGAVITFPFIVYLVVFAPRLISLTLGGGYAESAGVLQLMSLVGFSYFFYAIYNNALVSLGKQNLLCKIMLVSLVVLIASGILLIPVYGAAGAAIADGAGYLLACLLGYAALRKFVTFDLKQTLLKIILSSAVTGVFLIYSLPFVKTVFTGIFVSLLAFLVYAASVLLLRVFSNSDMELIKKILGLHADSRGVQYVLGRLCRFK